MVQLTIAKSKDTQFADVVPGLLGHFEGELVQVFLGLVQAVADIQLVAKNSEQSPFGGSSAPVVI